VMAIDKGGINMSATTRRIDWYDWK
jgi:hypothetical protein